MPENFEYPRDSQGGMMSLLAQINWDFLPKVCCNFMLQRTIWWVCTTNLWKHFQ